jgi:hypothetical protein
MWQKFIICTNTARGPGAGTSALDRNNITRYLESKGWPTWHWFEDLWLTVIPSYSVTPAQLRQELSALIGPTKFILIMKVDGQIDFSGYGAKAGWEWMAENWGDPE